MPQLFMPRSKIFQDIPTFRIMIHKCHKTLDCEVRMSVTSKFPEVFDVGMSSLRFFPGPEWPERWPCASWRDKMWEFGFGQFRSLDHWRSCWLNLNLWALVELGGTLLTWLTEVFWWSGQWRPLRVPQIGTVAYTAYTDGESYPSYPSYPYTWGAVVSYPCRSSKLTASLQQALAHLVRLKRVKWFCLLIATSWKTSLTISDNPNRS